MPNDPKDKSWSALEQHGEEMQKLHMRDLFAQDEKRFDGLHIELDGLLFDYSKHLITEDTLGFLIDLAKAASLEAQRDQMFAGEYINRSENRAALHVALRGSVSPDIAINGENLEEFVISEQARIKLLSTSLREENNITDVVNIGIGGSALGPNMVCKALANYADGPNVHFISNIDGAPLARLLSALNPESTVVIIASKTFTTSETMANATIAKDWLINGAGIEKAAAHLIAVTQNISGAVEFGLLEDRILPLREWIGGRYSLWSGIGLPIAVSVGYERFKELLEGARAMDTHFKAAPLEKNIPVIMGLLGVWNRNILGHSAQAILPYAEDLKHLPAYVQQLDMESNGKSVDHQGEPVKRATSPVVFGGAGTDCQHAFLQMLHQGSDIIPVDFIAAIQTPSDLKTHHTKLLANALAQGQALMEGNGHGEGAHKQFAGNRPSTTVLLDTLDPYHLGMLLALYEHKVFVQGCMWDINSFDQWGVELGKKLAENITSALENNKNIEMADSSTQNLITRIEKRSK